MNKAKIFSLMLIAIGATLLVGYPTKADAIALTLKRVIFQGSKRAEVITVINNSDVNTTYRIGWRNIVMTEENSLKSIPTEDGKSYENEVSKMVRFSPRRFALPPGGSQQVRMMLRMPSGLEDGEYRSHLYIRPEADAVALREKYKGDGKSGSFMAMLAGASMPIFVRKGKLDLEVDIPRFSATNNGNRIVVDYELVRSGSRSSYGDIDYICNQGTGDEYLLKFIRGISIYTEINSRVMRQKIKKHASKPTCRNLTVRYTETDGFVGKMVDVLAEKTVPVQ